MLTNENLILERETDSVERLRKEKVWLEVEEKQERMDSLIDAATLLKEKKSEVEQKLLSLKNEVVCVDGKSPLRLVQ